MKFSDLERTGLILGPYLQSSDSTCCHSQDNFRIIFVIFC